MYISGDKHSVDWVGELVSLLAPEGWEAYLFTPKRGKARTGIYGCANLTDKKIEICVSTLEKTPDNVHVVLHEIAHAIHSASPRYVSPQRVNGRYPRGSLHPPEFWDIAIVLYEHYNVMNIARAKEYIMGRKRIKAHMEYTRQMNRARNLIEGNANHIPF